MIVPNDLILVPMTITERNQEIVRRAFAGEKYRTLATEYGVTPEHISTIAIRAGVPPRIKRERGPKAAVWRGGRRINVKGYVLIYAPDHPRTNRNTSYVLEHILVAERVLGRLLPAHAVVHHVNESRQDNRPCNLVICPNKGYHALLHARMRALAACGNPNWRPCTFCAAYEDTANMELGQSRSWRHRVCMAAYQHARYVDKKASAA